MTTKAKLLQRPGGLFLLRDGSKQRRVCFSTAGQYLSLWSDGRLSKVKRSKMGSVDHGAIDETESDAHFEIQFPGKLKRILVAVGQTVEAKTPLVVVEAMKMEITLRAPKNGSVKKFFVTEGAQVEPGKPLLDFEESV